MRKLTSQKVRKCPRVPPQTQCRACRSGSHTLPRGWLSPYSLLRVQKDGCHLTSITLCPGEGCRTSQFLHLRREGEQEVTGQGPSWPSRDLHADAQNCGPARAGRRLSLLTEMEMRLGQPRPTLLYPQFPSVSTPQGALTEEGCLSPSWSAMGKARFYIFFLKNPTLSSFIDRFILSVYN